MTTQGERAASRRRLTFMILAALLLGGLMLSLGWGAVRIAPAQVVGIALDKAGIQTGIEFSPQQSAVLWNMRLPRVLMGVVVGAALALAGVAAVLVMMAGALLMRWAQVLNILLMDEGTAQALGVGVGRVRLALACLTTVAGGPLFFWLTGRGRGAGGW